MIRPAHPDDTAAVQRIVAEAYAPLAARMDKPPAPMLDNYASRIAEGVVEVLEQNGVVVAMIILVDLADALMLENVAVSPEVHGQGIGRRLTDHAETVARDRNYDKIRLYTHATMVENQAMYVRLGYVETTRGEDEGYDRVQFEKRL